MSNYIWIGSALVLALTGACGEDKGYGDPIDDPNAEVHANGAVTNAAMLTTDTMNDSALYALNSLSANYNLLAGLKLESQQQPQARRAGDTASAVDEACVDVSETGVVYDECDWNGTTVNGSVTRSGSDVSIDLELDTASTDTTQATDIRGDLSITDTAIVGYVDFDLRIDYDAGTVRAGFDGDYDVTLAEGCPVGGQVEIHATASASGQSQSVWVLAEYGPTCGDVVVR